MNKIKDFNNRIVTIHDFQSTFLILEWEHSLYRFNFKKKKEAYLKQKEMGKLKFYEQHPLLINYNESNHEVFLNSTPEFPEKYIKNIELCISESLKGWRNWRDYIEIDTGINYNIFLQNIQKGSGKLLKAPSSIVEKIHAVSEKGNIKISCFGEKTSIQHQLIVINNQYIIAEEFRLSQD